MAGDAGQRQLGSHKGGGDAAGVALDAGDLHKPGDRVADEAEDVLDGDGTGLAAHLRRAAGKLNDRRCSHGAGAAALGLTAAAGAGEAGVVADDHADGRGGEEGHHAVVFVEAVFLLHGDDGGWQNAAAACCRRGDDAPHGGVELAHSQRSPHGPSHEAAGEGFFLFVDAVKLPGVTAGEAGCALDIRIGALLDALLHDVVVLAHLAKEHLWLGVHLLGLVAQHDLADARALGGGLVDKLGDAEIF